jgi:type IV secretory pathway component VirB8
MRYDEAVTKYFLAQYVRTRKAGSRQRPKKIFGS